MTKVNWPNTRGSIIYRLHDANDEEAWNLVFDTYTPLVYRYCVNRGLQQSDALDVSQEVLSKLMKFEYRPERGKFRAWLGTVARNQVNLYWRKKKKNPQQEIVDDPSTTVDELNWERISCAHILDVALSRIKNEFNENEWKAFEMVALEVAITDGQKSFIWREGAAGDVAKQMKRSVQWVYNTKSQILERLRREIIFLAEELVII